MNEMKYIVLGEPLSCTTVTETSSPQIWGEYKQKKFNFRQDLKNQHNYRQFVDGSIKLCITFFMKSNAKHQPKELHTELPPILHLYCFVDHALKGIAYRKDCTVSNVELKKVYDSNPRTEITITRL